jgi:hypothetical protein
MQSKPEEQFISPLTRALMALAWVFFMIVIFFVAANYAANELGYDLNVKIFAGILIAGLAFVGLAAAVWRLFRLAVG